MTRTIAFIDGFNLYHALETGIPFRIPGTDAIQCRTPYRQYKWLDLRKLCSCFLTQNEKLEDVYFFTALPIWSPEKVERHQRYNNALESTGIRTIYGAFKEKEVLCKRCKSLFRKYEEKRTDVNIAIHLLGLAQSDAYDRALLVTGDSDLIPAVEWVRSYYPEKRISVIIPIARPVTKHLRQVASDYAKIKEAHLRDCQLPSLIQLKDGTEISSPYLPVPFSQ
jgi:uncharacterized LabA/DUF88 family protein